MIKYGHRFLLDANSLSELTEDQNTLHTGTYKFFNGEGDEIIGNDMASIHQGNKKC